MSFVGRRSVGYNELSGRIGVFAGLSPVVTPGSDSRRATRAYLGLEWRSGAKASPRPDGVVGVRSIDASSDDNVSGVDLNVRFGLDGTPGRVALSGVTGSRDLLVKIGLGYDFGLNETFVTGALQAPYLRAGVDYTFQSHKFIPYVEVNSLGRPDAVAASGVSLSCATPGYALVTRDDLFGQAQAVFDDVILADNLDVDGRGCVDPVLLGG